VEFAMTVDSFKFLPRLIAIFYQATEVQPEQPIPWTPLSKPLDECVFGLVTSGGLYHKGVESPFDLEREKAEPTWGDPTFRTIPRDIAQSDVGVSHLHINTEDVEKDFNILLPIHRFEELAEEGTIGGLAEKAYSFMGFQGHPPNTTEWRETYGPQVAEHFKAEGVDCVLLTPA
jgi:D-proline reductase (dithiol) PrdB